MPLAGPSRRAEALAAEHPEWQTWLGLVGAALHAADEPTWDTVDPALASERPAGAPLLAGAVIELDARAASRWVRALFEMSGLRVPAGLNGLAVLEAAVNQDHDALADLAGALGSTWQTVGPLAQLAALPLLLARGRALTARVPSPWRYGYCPVCGAWATLAELRGLEQERRLRCSRCGADWATLPLTCTFCGEADHRRLASLVPEAGGEARRVNACLACRGYVKALATLGAWAPSAIMLEDLASVDLDLAAIEHGYGRPDRPGCSLGLRVVPRAARRGLLGWRR